MADSRRWTLDDIPYADIDTDLVRDDETLFFVVASASLVESESSVYTDVLLNYYGDSEVGRWLHQQWQEEELQHGRALRRYVECVWPEMNWQRTYDAFCREYSLYCSVGQLEPTPTLELVARCVVETGTAALYSALTEYAREPVLAQLTDLIRRDEVRHYKHFHAYFMHYNRDQGHGRWPVFRALSRRLAEMRNEDADCALRHVFAQRYPETPIDSEHFRRISRAARGLVMRHVEPHMMVRMFLRPLQLPTPLRNSLQWPCSEAMRLFMRA